MQDAKWVEPVELELVVHVSNRDQEMFGLFLEIFWPKESCFDGDSESLDEIYTQLASKVKTRGSKGAKLQIFSQVAKLASALQKNSLANNKCNLKKQSRETFFCSKKKYKPRNGRKILSKAFCISELDLSRRRFKIIDYGNCYDYKEERYGLINTRQYRAPEVILSRPFMFWAERARRDNRRPPAMVRKNGHLVAGLSDFRAVQREPVLSGGEQLPSLGADREEVV